MQTLENRVGAGQLIPEPTSVEEISGFLLRAEQQRLDAGTASLSAIMRPLGLRCDSERILR